MLTRTLNQSWNVKLTLLLIFFNQYSALPEPKTCEVPGQYNGTLVVLEYCQHALTLLKMKPNSVREITRGYQGIKPLVCCPSEGNDTVTFVAEEDATKLQSTTEKKSTSELPPTTVPTIPHLPTRGLGTPPSSQEPIPTFQETAPAFRPPAAIQTAGGFQQENSVVISEITNVPHLPTTTSRAHQAMASDRFPEPVRPPRLPNQVGSLLPNRSVCGPPLSGERIFGGNLASIDEFPWIVRIKYARGIKEQFNCLGTLISDRYVLTAAHCVAVGRGFEIAGVRLGEWDVETITDCYEGFCNDPPEDRGIEQTIVHPGYNRTVLSNDIALLRLDRPVAFTYFIAPICLPTTDYVKTQDYMESFTYKTAGWGKTEFEKASIILRKVDLRAVDMEICKTALRLTYTNDKICAGGRQGEDTCNGDSGGGLVREVADNGNQNMYLYGITSFGSTKCGSEGIPSVFTRVVNYMPWILSSLRP